MGVGVTNHYLTLLYIGATGARGGLAWRVHHGNDNVDVTLSQCTAAEWGTLEGTNSQLIFNTNASTIWGSDFDNLSTVTKGQMRTLADAGLPASIGATVGVDQYAKPHYQVLSGVTRKGLAWTLKDGATTTVLAEKNPTQWGTLEGTNSQLIFNNAASTLWGATFDNLSAGAKGGMRTIIDVPLP